MSEKGKSHKAYPPEFKSKCVRELLDGGDTLSQVASRNGIAPSVLSKWKSQVLENMDAVFGAEAERRREAEAERPGRRRWTTSIASSASSRSSATTFNERLGSLSAPGRDSVDPGSPVTVERQC